MSAALDINLFIDYFGKCPVIHGKSNYLPCNTLTFDLYCVDTFSSVTFIATDISKVTLHQIE